MADDLADTLARVFAPFDDDERAQLIAWAGEELGTRSVITLMTDKRGAEWKVGEPSPSNEDAVVFAMLFDNAQRCCDVYCVMFVEQNGKEGVLYFKETCWNPDHTWGPLGKRGLWNEWIAFFGGADAGGGEEPPAKVNGAGESAGH